MRLQTDVTSDEIPRLVAALIKITGIKDWNRCIAKLAAQRAQNDLLRFMGPRIEP